MSIGSPRPDELRIARVVRGHSQARAAESIGYAPLSWRQWEKGIYRMPPCAWAVYQLGGLGSVDSMFASSIEAAKEILASCLEGRARGLETSGGIVSRKSAPAPEMEPEPEPVRTGGFASKRRTADETRELIGVCPGSGLAVLPGAEGFDRIVKDVHAGLYPGMFFYAGEEKEMEEWL